MRPILALIAALALTLAGSAPASAETYDIIVTRSLDCSAHTVTVTATGYGLAIDSAFQLVSGNASRVVDATVAPSGIRTVTTTFASSAVGENGTAVVRTRYGGYLKAGAQQSPGSPYVAAELISFRTC